MQITASLRLPPQRLKPTPRDIVPKGECFQPSEASSSLIPRPGAALAKSHPDPSPAPLQPHPNATPAQLQPHHQASPAPLQPYHQASPVPLQPYPNATPAPLQPYHQASSAPLQPYPNASPVPLQPYHQASSVPLQPHYEASPALVKPHHEASPAPVKAYYDASADQKVQAEYYQGLKLPENDPAEAFRRLSARLQDTHTRPLEYRPSQYLYPWVDLRPNGQLESIYNPRSQVEAVSPAKRQALDGALARAASMAAFCPEGVACSMALIESLGQLNCEHVVPQSWYDRQEPMRGDLHHLFACDSRCNSSRGNRVYREPRAGGVDEVENCGTITHGGKGFHPLGGKGAVARATLYFFLRYPQKAIAYRPEDLETLLKWHRQEPPSLYEKHRNVAIQELQGNRNPLIDHPHWAEQIDFRLGLADKPVDLAFSLD